MGRRRSVDPLTPIPCALARTDDTEVVDEPDGDRRVHDEGDQPGGNPGERADDDDDAEGDRREAEDDLAESFVVHGRGSTRPGSR